MYEQIAGILRKVKLFLSVIIFGIVSCGSIGFVFLEMIGHLFSSKIDNELQAILGIIIGYILFFVPISFYSSSLKNRVVLFLHKLSKSKDVIITNPDTFSIKGISQVVIIAKWLPFNIFLGLLFITSMFWIGYNIENSKDLPTQNEIFMGYIPIFMVLILVGIIAYYKNQLKRVIPMAILLVLAIFLTIYYYQEGNYEKSTVESMLDNTVLWLLKLLIVIVGFVSLLYDNRRFWFFFVFVFISLFSIQIIAFESLVDCFIRMGKGYEFIPRWVIYYGCFFLNSVVGAFYTALRYNLFTSISNNTGVNQLKMVLNIISYPIIIGTCITLLIIVSNVDCGVKNYITLMPSLLIICSYYWIEFGMFDIKFNKSFRPREKNL